MFRLDTGGGALGIVILIIAALFGGSYLLGCIQGICS